jgi:hypothetical protein
LLAAQPTLLDQAKSVASTALNTASDLAAQATTTASNLTNQALNSQTTANVTEQAKTLASQAHAQAHALAPSVIPAPGAGATASTAGGATISSTVGDVTTSGVDTSSDIEPQNPAETAKLEKLFESRPAPEELQEKGILKGSTSYSYNMQC